MAQSTMGRLFFFLNEARACISVCVFLCFVLCLFYISQFSSSNCSAVLTFQVAFKAHLSVESYFLISNTVFETNTCFYKCLRNWTSSHDAVLLIIQGLISFIVYDMFDASVNQSLL